MEKKDLPKLNDLYKGDIALMQDQNKLNLLLNQAPNPEWIKKHPFAKNVNYLTIQRIEFLMTCIFGKWKVEIKDVKIIANSVLCTIRLHYLDPLTSEWDWQDGVGAAPLQTDKDMGAIDFNHIKNDAVMKAAPAAESFAVKDAAHKLGKLFGKDLIRNDEIIYDALAKKFPGKTENAKIFEDPEKELEQLDLIDKQINK